MENQKNRIVLRTSLQTSPTYKLSPSIILSPDNSSKCFSLTKIKQNQSFTELFQTEIHLNSQIKKTDSNLSYFTDTENKTPEPLYKKHQTDHLLNRIKYLEGIIKEKDRRHREQIQSLNNIRLQSSESTTTSSISQENQKLMISQSKAKTEQLEQRIKQLQKQKQDQKMSYERKIKTMQEYMQTHFIEVQSQIIDQQFNKREEDFPSSYDLLSSKYFNQKKDKSTLLKYITDN